MQCSLSVLCLVTQSFLNLCNPMDYSLPSSSVHGNSPGNNTGVGCLALLQRNIPKLGIEPRSPTVQADCLPAEPPVNPSGSESTCNAGYPDSIPGSGKSAGEGIGYPLQYSWASLVSQLVKNPLAMQETWVDPWVGKIPWRRKWQSTLVFLLGKPHGQKSLGGYSPWSHRELDMTR